MQKTPTWKEAKRLWGLGFGIHWLHPRSKRPIESGWTTGPRKPWDTLSETYHNDFNVGVRLGTPSKIGDGYLAVIDVDIKSTEPHHRKEAMLAVAELIRGAECPEVRSGRGNGSRHLYCLTAEPFKTFNPAQSAEFVKVRMPSKSVSKKELEQLSEQEIKEGTRLSRAWEVSLYSDGRQVVLPPSIHPDTGKPYFWQRHLLDVEALPVLRFTVPTERGASRSDASGSDRARGSLDQGRERKEVESFEFTADEGLDVRWLPELSESVRSAIVAGTGVTDRSGYLLRATHALLSAGLERDGILSVLTDRSTYLGDCAFEHAKTQDRTRAAKWLWDYTVKGVMESRDPIPVFRGVEIQSRRLEESAALEQAIEIEDESDWKQYLEKTDKGVYRVTYNNLKTILQNVCPQKGFVGRDEFANNDFYLCDTPWGAKKGQPITDLEIVQIKDYCCERFRIEFNNNLIHDALAVVAAAHRFHPVRDYLKGLEWDGTPRIETWLMDYAGAEGPDDYVKAVSRKMLVAMVKRVFQPGCKFDHVVILEGNQGAGKSTLLSKLTGNDWFTDQPMVIGDKDSVLIMQNRWLVELGELSSLNRSEVEHMKAFITQTTDRIRAPYGKRVEDYPRQCIFVGSTNQDEYLKDETGNRRFWPVKLNGEIRFNEIEQVRDQLFAEAVCYYELKEPLYLEERTVAALAKSEQDKRGEVDEWHGAVADLINGPIFPKSGFEMRELAKLMDQFGAHKLDKSDQMRIAKILKSLGFERFQEKSGDRRKIWRPKSIRGGSEPPTNHLGGSTKSETIADFF